MIIRKRPVRLIAQILLAICFLCTNARSKSELPGPTVSDSAGEIVSTPWSDESNGLQVRVTSQRTYQYLEPISLSLEFRGVKSANLSTAALPDWPGMSPRLKLILTSYEAGVSQEYGSSDVTQASFGPDEVDWPYHPAQDSNFICNLAFDISVLPRPINLPHLRENRDSQFKWLAVCDSSVYQPPKVGPLPGKYTGRIELCIPAQQSGPWKGLLISPQFEFEIVSEDNKPDTVSFVFPHQLTLKRGPILSFDADQLDTIDVVVSPFHNLAYTIGGNLSTAYIPGLPVPPVALFGEDQLREHLPDSTLVLPIPEGPVFEDGQAVIDFECKLTQSFNSSSRRCYGSKGLCINNVLWSATLETVITREEYDNMKVPAENLFEYHTLLVPKRVRLTEGTQIWFSTEDLLPRGIRIAKGSGLVTVLAMDSMIIDSYPGLPDSNLLRLPERIPSNSSIRLNISTHEHDSAIHRPQDNPLPTATTAWSGDFVLTNVGDEFGITAEQVREIPKPLSYRRYEIPRKLILTDDLEVYGDTANLITVEFEKRPDDIILGLLECHSQCTDGYEFNALIPTDFQGSLATLKYPTIDNDSITCELSLYSARRGDASFWFNVVPTHSYPRLWEKTYRIPVTEKQIKKINKQAREWHKKWGHRRTPFF